MILARAWSEKRYAGIGIAMLSLSENTVSVTIRQSDNDPIASVAATASCSRPEATGAERPSKPAGRGDRVMVEFLLSVSSEADAGSRLRKRVKTNSQSRF
jgi:hypothetical protein